MNLAPLSPLGNHLWQSSLFLVFAALLTLAFKRNSARVRHWIWFAALCKFLVPLALLSSLGAQFHWRTAPPPVQNGFSVAVEQAAQPFRGRAIGAIQIVSPAPDVVPALPLAFAIWACGFLGFATSWGIEWQRLRAAVRDARPAGLDLPVPALFSSVFIEPSVFGILRPVLLVPEGITKRLPPRQLRAVIAHELCHVRYRDNLIAAIQMFVETVFWFYPLVWWTGRRMIGERERACDEEVLRLGCGARDYARGILSVCELCVQSRLTCAPGVTGAHLKKRLAAIAVNRRAAALSRSKKAALACAVILAVTAPIAVGIANTPLLRAQTAANAPEFEVAVIKACDPKTPRTTLAGRVTRGGVEFNCETLETSIRQAFVMHRNAAVENRQGWLVKIEGGPAWINKVPANTS